MIVHKGNQIYDSNNIEGQPVLNINYNPPREEEVDEDLNLMLRDLNDYFNDSIKQNKKYNESQKYQSRNIETLNYNNLNDSVKQSKAK